jgi:hypothetical protein
MHKAENAKHAESAKQTGNTGLAENATHAQNAFCQKKFGYYR